MIMNFTRPRTVAAKVRFGSGALLLAWLAFSLLTGCRITEKDIERWATRASGPKKLVAVLQHDKYSRPLRVDAALTLITMKPRGGQAIGLQGGEETKGLLRALKELPSAQRRVIVDSLVEPLEQGMNLGMKEGQDPTFAYKDAAYALLTYSEGALVENPTAKLRLRAALAKWTQADFARRMDDTSQLFGMEQVLRLLQDDAIKNLTPLLDIDFKKLRELSKLVSELGSDTSKHDASQRLVTIAKHVDSPQWIASTRPRVSRANQTAGLTVSEAQLEKQLSTYQEEELKRVFAAMKFVGQAPSVEYLISYASETTRDEARRVAALAALEGNLDRKSPQHAQAMLSFLESDTTPDKLRDVAARRVGELSRDQVAERLYKLLEADRWQLRWTAASLLLQMSEADHVAEFVKALGSVRELAMTEALSYGPLLGGIKGLDAKKTALAYASSSEAASVRVSALGYFYRRGDKADLPLLAPFAEDRGRVPPCPKDPKTRGDAAGCAWTCTISEHGKPQVKQISTIGDFVTYCLVPALETRAAESPSAAPAAPEAAPPANPATAASAPAPKK